MINPTIRKRMDPKTKYVGYFFVLLLVTAFVVDYSDLTPALTGAAVTDVEDEGLGSGFWIVLISVGLLAIIATIISFIMWKRQR